MLLNSFNFLALFPFIFLLYWFIPIKSGRCRRDFLLMVSYALYMSWKPAWALLLLAITAITYLGAIVLEKAKDEATKRKRLIKTLSVLVFIPLIFWKYYNFISENLEQCFYALGLQVGLPGLNWAIPIGISFFTFQAAGYIFDVYFGKIKAEHCFRDYALFVSFFPQIAAGPISKAGSLLPQLKNLPSFNYTKAVQGLQCMLWGVFLKTVLADCLGLYVDMVFNNYEFKDGGSCLMASILYSFQIYGDFAGYSLMAVGIAKLIGIDLVNNFERPYLAVSITEFWRRWHISLSSWLRDYVYIPLGGNRCSKLRGYLNIMITFLVSGLWHGANWNFIVWGCIHGFFQIIEKALGLQKCTGGGFIKAGRILITFSLATFAWIFFRMPSFEDACGILSKITTDFSLSGMCLSGVPRSISAIIKLSLFMLVFSELIHEWIPRYSPFRFARTSIRWGAYLIVTMMVLLFGVLDAGQFIYVNF